MPVALKASWEVRAGLIPGQPMPEYTKQFHYTSEDKEEDEIGCKDNYAYHSKFSKIRCEAMDYYSQMSMPSHFNWTEMTFIWY